MSRNRFKKEIDYYEILQVSRNANAIIIKKAYRAILNELCYHPDKGGDEEKAKLINEAYGILSNELSRSEYDSFLKQFKFSDESYESRSQKPPPSPPSSPGRDESSYANGKDGQSNNNHKIVTWFILIIIGIIVIYVFTKYSNSTISDITEPRKNETNLPFFESKDNNLNSQRTEASGFIEVYTNPELNNYLEFIKKYPAHPRKDELISRLISSDPNLPSEKYWHAIIKNEKGYWEIPLSRENSIKLVWIPSSELLEKISSMENNDRDRNLNEMKREGFWMGKYEVTVDQYKKYCDENGINLSDFTLFGDLGNEPIRNISWYEADKYCEWLGCRLPTELEWGIAARGDQDFTNYPWGEVFDPAFCNINSSKTMEVGSFKSNDFGLFDMIGNVAEWLRDWYSDDMSNLSKPELYKVIKGGSFKDKPAEATLPKRNYMFPAYKGETYGFRVAMD